MTLIGFLKQYFSSFRGRTAFFYTDPEQAEPAKVTTEELERDIRRAAAFGEEGGRAGAEGAFGSESPRRIPMLISPSISVSSPPAIP